MSAHVSHSPAISRPFAIVVVWAAVALGVAGLFSHHLWTQLPAARIAGLDLVSVRHELTIGEAQWWRLTTEQAP
ncbi:MAG: hypothetical protein M3414_04780 [Pseudomonadota bacterium]|nr:hypothetical protein [Pseudomonadota bacterium]